MPAVASSHVKVRHIDFGFPGVYAGGVKANSEVKGGVLGAEPRGEGGSPQQRAGEGGDFPPLL
jgi:hypothetical protein